jgi:hypothetical protein
MLNVELVRASATPEASRRALALYLLTAARELRLVRAYATQAEAGWSCGMQVNLPVAPASEEIDHALAALSMAHRMCAREANVLLDQAAARCYLAVRDTSNTNGNQPVKEK